MRHAELLADLAQIARRAGLVLHDRRAADHLQIRDLGEVGQDLVLHAIGEEGVRFFFAQIFERKDRDAFLRNRSDRRRCGGIGRLLRRTMTQKEKTTCDERGNQQQRKDDFMPWHAPCSCFGFVRAGLAFSDFGFGGRRRRPFPWQHDAK